MKKILVLSLCFLLFPFITHAICWSDAGSAGCSNDSTPIKVISPVSLPETIIYTAPKINTPIPEITPTCTFGGISPNCNPSPSTSSSAGGGLISTTTLSVPVTVQDTKVSMPTTFDVSLKYGSRGDAVEQLQDFLQDQGMFSGKMDGKFGLGTRKAVIAFQLANGLKGDGYFGLVSRIKANSILAIELKPSTDAEQAETGTTLVPGCTSTSAYSSTTGQSCH